MSKKTPRDWVGTVPVPVPLLTSSSKVPSLFFWTLARHHESTLESTHTHTFHVIKPILYIDWYRHPKGKKIPICRGDSLSSLC